MSAAVIVVVLALLLGRVFESARLGLSNNYFVPAPVSGTVVIVALDDASLQAYGRTPAQWSRAIYADLMRALTQAQARVVAIDMLFDLPTPQDARFAEAIQTARDSDARTRTVLAQAGVQLTSSVSGRSHSLRFDNTLAPVTTLADAADYVGYVNTFPDIDGTIRRQPSLVEIGGETQLSFSLAVFAAFLRLPASALGQVVQVEDSTLRIASAHALAVDELGLWVQNFFGPASNRVQTTFPVVSVRDVLNGQVDQALFADKIVLVGVINNSDSGDLFPVPSDTTGRIMAGVEVQANAIETLIQKRAPYEQPLLSQVGMVIVLASAASLLYAQLRWYWTFVAALILLAGGFMLASVAFSTQLMIVNLFHSALALTLPVLITIGFNLSAEIRQREKTERLLDTVVEVSSQRLAMEKILPLIASDVQRVVGASSGEIWLLNGDDRSLQRAYPVNPAGDPSRAALCLRAQAEGRTVADGDQLAVPIIWQQKLLGVVAAQVSGPARLKRRAPELLEDLVRQIAPDLENMLLFAALKRQNQLVEAVFARSPSGILVLNDRLQVIKSNAEVSSLLALDGAGQNAPGSADVPEAIAPYLWAGLQSGQAFRYEAQIDGKTFALDAAPLGDDGQWVVILTDISALAELSKLKTRLIRMASHDLKNPLAQIIGYTQLALDADDPETPLPGQTRQFLDTVMRSAATMKAIISGILSLEHLRSGAIQLDTMDLAPVVEAALAQHYVDAAAKGQTIHSEIEENLPQIQGNLGHLTQAITNLMDNAIKYTPDDGQITVRLNRSGSDCLRLEVEDTGYGIPEAAQARLFTEFYRVRTPETEDIPGSGLGLSLVKSIVEAHHGRVWVQSQPGVGSTFIIELPIDHATSN